MAIGYTYTLKVVFFEWSSGGTFTMSKVLAVVYPTHPLIIQLTCKEIKEAERIAIHQQNTISASYFT